MNAAKRITLLIVGILLLWAPGIRAEEAINPYLQNMVDVRASSDESWQEAQRMISRMNHVENSILYQTSNNGAVFILADTPITDQPEFAHLKGVVPRGHTSSWDEIPGAGGHVSMARIGYSEYGKGHSTINLELHEYGHVVDSFTVGVQVSETEEFRAIHAEEVDQLFGGSSQREYYNMAEEYFGEAFAMYYYTDDSRSELAGKAPKTYAFFEDFDHRILSAGEVTGNTATMYWDAHEDAAEYEMFRNGESVGTTTSSSFRIEGLNTDTTYDFHVVAKDGNGQELYTSYTRSALTGSVADADTSELEATISEVEEAYQDRNMGESLTRALANSKSYISDVYNLKQDEVDNLNSNLEEAWEADETAQREAEEQREREEQEAREEVERKAEEERLEKEKQEQLEAEEREKAAEEARKQELQNTIIKVVAGLAVLAAVIIAIIVYRKRK